MARVKPHAKIHLSVAHHPKTEAVWSNPIQRGMLVEIWRLAIERYAPMRNDVLGLKMLDRMSISGASTAEEADIAVQLVCKRMKYRVRKHRNRWDVTIRNLAKKHGIEGPELTAVRGEELTPKKEERREKKEEKRKEESGGASRPSPALLISEGKGQKPESFAPEQMLAIRAWAKSKGFPNSTLNEALERFREWEPLKMQRRTQKQWVAAFQRICREAVEDGKIGKPKGDDLKPKGPAYQEWRGYDEQGNRR